ncbi:MAG: PIN domain-containing protein [Patescibacteria group bacterium]|nr:PIN domain-containing protein [Patescibacteria group bacterium]MDD5121396.1 PIN domain-containing protein [Patescibacteria group bacterium]MDD5221878.1 PIN domain-containing protein [Patescibacteria group bacterium]MDD5395685.1 PIN domain-containing protein [Patescibacteria group bacterium]
MFKKIRLYFWGLSRKKKNVVVDTCVLLSGQDRERLKYLKNIYIPRAVLEQVLRMGLQKEKEEDENMHYNIFFIIQIIILQKILNRKWHVAGSSRSGLLQSIENKTLAEFDTNTAEQLRNIFRKNKREWNLKREKINLAPISDPHATALRDLIGTTDLRIIASCLSLKRTENDKIYLLTRDKSLSVLAQAMGIIVIKRAQDI